MTEKPSAKRREIAALRVNQWLKAWNNVKFDPKLNRRKPPEHFFMFTMPAVDLKALSGIYRRSIAKGVPRSEDLGIQRRHEPNRAKEISEFIKFGYPWSTLNDAKRASGNYDDLRKPGWLPTAIVVNLLLPGDERDGKKTTVDDVISVKDNNDGTAAIVLPKQFTGPQWKPKSLAPIEIIDGQHRLWSFEEDAIGGQFELPVVAFTGLDRSWQAYLFWTINIKPKRINPSLAFDLYPLLRTEDWLEKFEGHSVYREARAQEITEALWSYPKSPWYRRINMLGERGQPGVSQAAWIRSLMSTYIKSYEGQGITIGGLFGAPTGEHKIVLPWSRAQQAAFLILVWQSLQAAVKDSKEAWATELRKKKDDLKLDNADLAFTGSDALFNSDQGVRGVLAITNDLTYILATKLDLRSYLVDDQGAPATDENAIALCLKSLTKHPVSVFIETLTAKLVKYDWRTSSAPGLTETQKIMKLVFRGGSGYKELRRQLLVHLSDGQGDVSKAAKIAIKALGYDA